MRQIHITTILQGNTMFTKKIHSWKFFYTTTGRDVRDKLGSGQVRKPYWLLGILGYVGYFRVFWYLREYPKYLVIPDILCYRIPEDFQNWIGSGIYKNVGYWVPVGPFPWVNFWRICVLDRGANWHLRCFGPPPMKTKPPSKLEARPDE